MMVGAKRETKIGNGEVVVLATGEHGFPSTFNKSHVLSPCVSQVEGPTACYRFSPGWYCGSVAVKQSSRKDWRYSNVGLSSGSFFQQSFIISCRDSGQPWGQGMRYPRSTCSSTSRFTIPEGKQEAATKGAFIAFYTFSRIMTEEL